MHRIAHLFSPTAGALAASMLVAACGGGGASAPNSVPGSSGFAVDGYLSGATVLCDSNGNGELDTGERSVTADDTGFFKFAPSCSAGLVATGGTSTDTNLPFRGKLKAPPGSTMVTPLTTLMANGMTLDQINAALGLPTGTDVTKVDPARAIGGELQNADLYRKTLAIQQILQKTAETLANLVPGGGAAALPAIYSEAAVAVATQLRANPALLSGNSLDATTLTALVNAAATRVASSAVLTAEVKTAASSVNPASLAQVVSGALKVQTDRILQASDALVVSTTSIAQLDTRIAGFVLLNQGALAGAPNATITSLASDIAATISGGGSPPPPPPNGTVLISWDEATLPATNIGSFGDGGPSVAAAPAGGSGNALKLDRSGGVNFGGTFFNVPAIPFAADRKTITARVYATRANAVVYLKVEAAGGVFTELPATVTAANTWQTLTWVLNGVNPANSYTTMVFSADTDVPSLGAQTYWIDDITLAPSVAVPPPPPSSSCATSTQQCISFSESTIAALGFEGLISTNVVDDPVAGASNKVLRMVKGPSGQPWAGATIYTMGDPGATPSVLTIDTVGLASSKVVTVRSYSGAPAGTKVTLKLENAIDPGQNVLAETVTTAQNAWETLTFDFANPTSGSFSATTVYNKASIFPAFSAPQNPPAVLAADTNFYFDELKYAVAGSTPPPPPPPSGTNTVLISWDEATLPATNIGSFGDGGPSVAAAPTGGSGNALKLDRSGGVNFGGTFFNVPAIPFAADRKTITARVYATRANAVVYLKVEAAGGVFTELPATVTAANTWQTLTWVLSSVNPASSYTTMVFSADTDVASLGAQTYWIDDITLLASAGGSGGGTATPITFSSGFAANSRTVEGGEFGGFSGSNQDGFNCSGDPAFCGRGGDTAPGVPAADSFFFYYYQTPTPATALYAGIYLQAPGVTGGLSATADTAGVRINGQTTLKFNFNPNPEWYQSSTNNFMVQFDMGRRYLVGGNPCHVQLRRVVAPTSAASVSYTLNLNEFVVVQDCAQPGMTAAAALAGSDISQISFQAAGGGSAVGDGTRTTGANLSVPAGAVYPTTLVLKGAVSFQ